MRDLRDLPRNRLENIIVADFEESLIHPEHKLIFLNMHHFLWWVISHVRHNYCSWLHFFPCIVFGTRFACRLPFIIRLHIWILPVNIPTLTLFVILRNRLTSKFVLHYYFTILIPFHYVVLWGKLMNLWREYASVKSMHTLILIWKSRCLWWWAFPRNRRRYTNLFIYAFTYAFIHLSSHLLMHLFMHLFCIYLFFYNYIVEIFFLILIFFESNFINPNQLINREHLNFYCILFNYFI